MIAAIFGKWLKNKEHHQQEAYSLELNVKLAQDNCQHRNELIEQYQPFIAKSASKVCHRYVDISMDEFSVALEAFNEAITKYNEQQGSSFLSFADMVIRRRVIDYIRKETIQTKGMVLEQEKQDEEDNPMESYALISASVDQYHLKQERERRQEEILVYKDKLKKYDITFNELVEQCPKHQDARENARQIAKLLASTPKLKQFLIEKKQLPIKDLLNCVRCGRKTIERNRKYIIAMALISIYQLDSLRSYIEPEQALSGKEDIQDEKRHRRRNSTP